MGTQYVYSRSLAGFLCLVALVALCGGGCGKTVSEACPVLEPVWSAPRVGNSDEVAQKSDEGTVTISDEPNPDVAEAGVLGYSDPETSEATCTPPLVENGYMLEQPGDTDEGCSDTMTPSTADWEEDRMGVVNEESNAEVNEGGEPGDYHNGMYEETPCTPPVTEQEYTPEQTGDTGREYMREPTGDGEDAGSDTVIPYSGGEDETRNGGDCFDVTSDGLGSVMMNKVNWMWVNNVRLVLNPWWQAMITGADETGVLRHQADLPSTLRDVDASESSCGPEAGSSP